MKIIVSITFILLLCNWSTLAQSKPKWMVNGQAGVLYGASEPAWQFQLITGASYKTFSLGVGYGIDAYHTRSKPLFAHLRKNIFNKSQTPFVYLDLGGNSPTDRKQENNWQIMEFSGGFYFDAGAGYSWALGKRLRFNMGIGYSEKKIEEKRYPRFSINDLPWSESFDYTFRRLNLKAGVSF